MASVDQDEVNKISSLLGSWDPEGNMKLAHRLNTLRLELIVSTVGTTDAKPLSGKKILDAGCGNGILSESLAKLGAEVIGIDPSTVMINAAKEHSRLGEFANKPTYYHTTIEEHAIKFPCHYDAVVASEVIEHVSNPTVFLEACVDTLRPGGRIFITTPNKTWLSNLFVIYLGENVLKFMPKGIHSFDKFIPPNEVGAILRKKNCQVDNVYGFTYVPVIQRFIWSYFQSIWYALVATKLE